MTYYKVVASDGSPIHGGNGKWPLPTDTEPGEWREVEGEIVPCATGLHLTDLTNLKTWAESAPGDLIYRAEVEGDVIDHGNKFVARKVRLLPNPSTIGEFTSARCPTVPPIKYTMTAHDRFLADLELPKGHTLTHKVLAAQAKVEDHVKRMATARKRYDAKVAKGMAAWAARWT